MPNGYRSPLEQHEPLVGNAAAAGVTKQRYAVGALGDRTGLPHHPGLSNARQTSLIASPSSS
jgi:hypothetical protein